MFFFFLLALNHGVQEILQVLDRYFPPFSSDGCGVYTREQEIVGVAAPMVEPASSARPLPSPPAVALDLGLFDSCARLCARIGLLRVSALILVAGERVCVFESLTGRTGS